MRKWMIFLSAIVVAVTAQSTSIAASDTEWDRTVLPRPPQPFEGVMKRTLEGSVASFTQPVKPPPGAPNILLVLIDDAGFGNPFTFGGPVATPTFDKLATEGLRYNRFHVTALCSPTRAALLSGRNHHAVGFGSIAEVPGGWPGYNTNWPTSAASIAKTLQLNGYNTAAIGKWHLTPDDQQGPAGPFDRWPNALGFDYFWGFLGGETGQFDPVLTENNTIIGVPTDKNFYFNDAMVQHSINWIRGQKAQAPDKPFFLYFSTGATHAPHQVPKEWSDKYKGKFDQGWDQLREQTFARQKQLGVIPPNAKLTPRDPAFPAWDSVPPDVKKLYGHQMEVYAGYQENADNDVGRVVKAIEDMGLADNTLIFYIFGDNGASMEGTETGTFNEMTTLNGVPLTADQQLKAIKAYGGLEKWGGSGMIPPIYNRSYSISADLDNPGRAGALGLRPGVAGVIVAESSFLGGFSIYVENGHLKHTYSLLGLKLDTISSRDAIPAGKVNVRYEFTADKPGEFGTGGASRLFINGKQQAEAKMEHSVPFRFASYEGMDIGTDNGLPVVPKFEYAKVLPKYFRGTIEKVEFDLGPAKLSAEDLQRIYLERFASAVRN